jgi:hypothetical protein
MWTCNECGRTFGKRRAHVCEPGLTVDAYFAARDPSLRKIYDAVAKHVRKLNGAHTEAVNVGILFKRDRTFAELRPRRVGFGLSLVMRRPLNDPRVARSVPIAGDRIWHVVVLESAKDVDAEVRDWITEAFAS